MSRLSYSEEYEWVRRKTYLVEKILDECGDTKVIPVAMDDEHLHQHTEAAKGKVGRTRRLSTFLTKDTQANMGFLDHRDVVGAIADGRCHGMIRRGLDHLDYLRLLNRAHTTAQNGHTAQRHL